MRGLLISLFLLGSALSYSQNAEFSFMGGPGLNSIRPGVGEHWQGELSFKVWKDLRGYSSLGLYKRSRVKPGMEEFLDSYQVTSSHLTLGLGRSFIMQEQGIRIDYGMGINGRFFKHVIPDYIAYGEDWHGFSIVYIEGVRVGEADAVLVYQIDEKQQLGANLMISAMKDIAEGVFVKAKLDYYRWGRKDDIVGLIFGFGVRF